MNLTSKRAQAWRSVPSARKYISNTTSPVRSIPAHAHVTPGFRRVMGLSLTVPHQEGGTAAAGAIVRTPSGKISLPSNESFRLPRPDSSVVEVVVVGGRVVEVVVVEGVLLCEASRVVLDSVFLASESVSPSNVADTVPTTEIIATRTGTTMVATIVTLLLVQLRNIRPLEFRCLRWACVTPCLLCGCDRLFRSCGFVTASTSPDERADTSRTESARRSTRQPGHAIRLGSQ
jgi:hypothetical protein